MDQAKVLVVIIGTIYLALGDLYCMDCSHSSAQ